MPLLAALLLALAATAVTAQDTWPEIDATCETGSGLMVMIGEMVIPKGSGERTMTGVSLEMCSKYCVENKSPEGQMECAAFNYIRGTNVCVFYSGYDSGDVVADASADIYHKSCVDSGNICSSPFTFEAKPGMILVGFAREVVPATTVGQCLTACLNSAMDFNIICESVMYYPDDNECILNTEDRRDSPGAFVTEETDNVLYLDNNCAGSTCFSPQMTQYVAFKDKVLFEERDVVIPQTGKEDCAYLCSQGITDRGEAFNCKSFAVTAEGECVLSDETALPTGRAEVETEDGAVYYEKKCVTAKETCRNTPAYERVPGMILVGFAAYVLENIPSVAQCLDYCTSPPADQTEANFVCKSAVYYYKEQECIMNTATKDENPEVFVPEGQGFHVDYFQPSCSRDVERCENGAPALVRYAGMALGPLDFSLIRNINGNPRVCKDECYESAPAKCRGFNYIAGKCELLTISRGGSAGALEEAEGDAYEMMCLEGAEAKSLVNQPFAFDAEVDMKRNGEPMKVMPNTVSLPACLSACLTNFGCEGVNYDKNSGACHLMDKRSGAKRLVEDAAFDYYEATVVNNNRNAEDQDGSSSGKKPTKKNKKDEVKKLATPPPTPGIQTICNFDGMKVQVTRENAFSGAVFVKNKYDTCRVEVSRDSSVTLSLGFPPGVDQVGGPKPPGVQPPGNPDSLKKPDFEPGPPGAEDFASRRRRQANGLNLGGARIQSEAVPRFSQSRPSGQKISGPRVPNLLRPQIPHNTRDCGLKDLGDGKFTTTIVVQDNNLGIPGLVTSSDSIYQVSCDYGKIINELSVANAELKLGEPIPTKIKPQGKIEMSTPIMMQMLGADAPEPVLQADIGDMLELNWEMMAIDDDLDFFVRECIAEQGGTELGQSLKLMERGCPTPAVAGKIMPEGVNKVGKLIKTTKLQAFRFDGSRAVRIVCQLDICSGECNPADCSIGGSDVESLGRKKRGVEQENSVEDIETEKYKIPRRAKAMTSFVVMDPHLDQQLAENYHKAKAHSVHVQPKIEIEEELRSRERVAEGELGKVCLPKATFLGVFLFLGVLALIQASVVGAFLAKRMTKSV